MVTDVIRRVAGGLVDPDLDAEALPDVLLLCGRRPHHDVVAALCRGTGLRSALLDAEELDPQAAEVFCQSPPSGRELLCVRVGVGGRMGLLSPE